jgi:hypothetical protein
MVRNEGKISINISSATPSSREELRNFGLLKLQAMPLIYFKTPILKTLIIFYTALIFRWL